MNQAIVTVVGIRNVIKGLMLIGKRIEKGSEKAVHDVTELGKTTAQSLAPFFTGELISAITTNHFQQNKEGWIISSQPKGDAIPTNILFEEGTYPNPRDPQTLRFMTNTRNFLEEELSRRLNLEISEVIKE